MGKVNTVGYSTEHQGRFIFKHVTMDDTLRRAYADDGKRPKKKPKFIGFVAAEGRKQQGNSEQRQRVF